MPPALLTLDLFDRSFSSSARGGRSNGGRWCSSYGTRVAGRASREAFFLVTARDALRLGAAECALRMEGISHDTSVVVRKAMCSVTFEPDSC